MHGRRFFTQRALGVAAAALLPRRARADDFDPLRDIVGVLYPGLVRPVFTIDALGDRPPWPTASTAGWGSRGSPATGRHQPGVQLLRHRQAKRQLGLPDVVWQGDHLAARPRADWPTPPPSSMRCCAGSRSPPGRLGDDPTAPSPAPSIATPRASGTPANGTTRATTWSSSTPSCPCTAAPSPARPEHRRRHRHLAVHRDVPGLKKGIWQEDHGAPMWFVTASGRFFQSDLQQRRDVVDQRPLSAGQGHPRVLLLPAGGEGLSFLQAQPDHARARFTTTTIPPIPPRSTPSAG